MIAKHEKSTSERVKTFLWFSGIAILLAAAIVLWIRKATTPASNLLEQTTQVAEQQRASRLFEELQAAMKLVQEADPQRQRAGLAKIEALAQQNPDFVLAREALVRVALGLNEPALANRVARELARQYPDAVQAHALLGLVHLNARQWTDAEAELTKAIELNKQQQGEPQWSLHGLLAETYLGQGKTSETDAELRKAADINLRQAVTQIAQTSVDLSERLGIVLLKTGKPEELEPAYLLLRGAASYLKDNAEAQYQAAAAALRKERADEAKTFLAAAEKLKPGDPRFAQLQTEIARAPTTTRAASGPSTMPATAPSAAGR